MSLFSKKAKKIKNSKFRPDRKKYFGKSSSTKFLDPLGESMFKNQPNLDQVKKLYFKFESSQLLHYMLVSQSIDESVMHRWYRGK
jgi:hypothetical protein